MLLSRHSTSHYTSKHRFGGTPRLEGFNWERQVPRGLEARAKGGPSGLEQQLDQTGCGGVWWGALCEPDAPTWCLWGSTYRERTFGARGTHNLGERHPADGLPARIHIQDLRSDVT